MTRHTVRIRPLLIAAGLAALVCLGYWQLERSSVAISAALFREAALGWNLNPEDFVAVGRRTLPNQPATRVWERRGAFGVEELQVTEAESLVCRSRQVQGSPKWEHMGCRQVAQ